MDIHFYYKEIIQWKCVNEKHCRKVPIIVEELTNFLFNWEKDVVSDSKVIQQVMPKLVSKGNDKYGGHCDGGFSELARCCVYYSVIIMFDVKWLCKSWVATVTIPAYTSYRYGSRYLYLFSHRWLKDVGIPGEGVG